MGGRARRLGGSLARVGGVHAWVGQLVLTRTRYAVRFFRVEDSKRSARNIPETRDERARVPEARITQYAAQQRVR